MRHFARLVTLYEWIAECQTERTGRPANLGGRILESGLFAERTVDVKEDAAGELGDKTDRILASP
jgi:hypothetical protein